MDTMERSSCTPGMERLLKKQNKVKQLNTRNAPTICNSARSVSPIFTVTILFAKNFMTKILIVDDEPSIVNLSTAKTEETDKIVGLSVGADDYVTKPFSPRELMARVKAALRRLQTGAGSRSETSMYSFHHLRMDAGARTVTVDENPIELTAIEFDLLKALVENRGRVLSREQLLEKVWGGDYFGEMRVVDVHLGHVRQKIGRDDLIITIRGIGYRFEDESL